jgi:hypothetical protein
MHMRELKWSPEEKAIARKAFNGSLQRELASVMAEFKKKAEKIQEPSEMWDLEEYLEKARKKIDRDYDYRYSVLPEVFGLLISQGRLSEKELAGLGEDKLSMIRRIVSFRSE